MPSLFFEQLWLSYLIVHEFLPTFSLRFVGVYLYRGLTTAFRSSSFLLQSLSCCTIVCIEWHFSHTNCTNKEEQRSHCAWASVCFARVTTVLRFRGDTSGYCIELRYTVVATETLFKNLFVYNLKNKVWWINYQQAIK